MTADSDVFQEQGFEKAFRSFTETAEKKELEWLLDIPFPIHSDRGLAFLILFSSLRGLIPDSRLAPVLFELWERWGLDLFRLSHVKYEELANGMVELSGISEGHLQKIPGVLRSVSDFFFKTGSLKNWLDGCKDGDTVLQALSNDIFWMGKSSVYRNKPRFFLWLLNATHYPNAELFRMALPPITQGHIRFILEWASTKSKKAFFDASPRIRLEKMAQFLVKSGLPSAWQAVPALNGFLEKIDINRFRCQTVWSDCSLCPMVGYCTVGKKQSSPSSLSGPFPYKVKS
jgi:hypothetical protein